MKPVGARANCQPSARSARHRRRARRRRRGAAAGQRAVAERQPVEAVVEAAEERVDRPQAGRGLPLVVVLVRLEQDARRAPGSGSARRSSEITVAAAIVTANWRKNWPEMPPINAAGMNTAQSTSAMAISAPPTSSIVRCAASRGDRPARRCRSTFSTTTIASSTTMPMASTRPNSDSVVERIAERRHHREGADQRDRDRDDRDDRRAPGLQEEDDDDDDEDDRLADRLHHLVHRLGDELGRVVDDVVVAARAGSPSTAPPSSRAADRRSRARSSRAAGRSGAARPGARRDSRWRV